MGAQSLLLGAYILVVYTDNLTVRCYKLDDSSGKGGLGARRGQSRKTTLVWHLQEGVPQERQRPGKQGGGSQVHIDNG